MKTKLGFENEGVLNPAIIQNETGIHLFYRAVKKGNFSTIGYCKLSSPTEVEERNDTPILFFWLIYSKTTPHVEEKSLTKSEKKKQQKKALLETLRKNKENEEKERVIREERFRLHDISVKNKQVSTVKGRCTGWG